MPDLKPCPFCGARAFIQKTRGENETMYSVKANHSPNCYLVYVKSPMVFTKEAAERTWNLRPTPKKYID